MFTQPVAFPFPLVRVFRLRRRRCRHPRIDLFGESVESWSRLVRIWSDRQFSLPTHPPQVVVFHINRLPLTLFSWDFPQFSDGLFWCCCFWCKINFISISCVMSHVTWTEAEGILELRIVNYDARSSLVRESAGQQSKDGLTQWSVGVGFPQCWVDYISSTASRSKYGTSIMSCRTDWVDGSRC